MALLLNVLRRIAPMAEGDALRAARQKFGIGARSVISGGAGLMAASAASALGDPLPAPSQQPSSLTDARARVAQLEDRDQTFSSVDATNPESVKQAQRVLLASGIPVRVDGNIGPETAAAIRQFRDQNARDLQTARNDLQDAQHQAAARATRAGPERQAAREVLPYAGVLLGLAIGHGSRSAAVRRITQELAERNIKTDALLSAEPLLRGGRTSAAAQIATTTDAARRMANVNEFWRLGGAGERVPFKPTGGSVGFAGRRGAASASSLFAPKSSTARVPDWAVIGGGAADAAASTAMLSNAQKELDAAQAAADQDPSEANLARLEQAKDQVAVWETAQRVGFGVAAGRAVGTFSHRYPTTIRPNVAGAEGELTLLNQFLAAQRRAARGRGQ